MLIVDSWCGRGLFEIRLTAQRAASHGSPSRARSLFRRRRRWVARSWRAFGRHSPSAPLPLDGSVSGQLWTALQSLSSRNSPRGYSDGRKSKGVRRGTRNLALTCEQLAAKTAQAHCDEACCPTGGGPSFRRPIYPPLYRHPSKLEEPFTPLSIQRGKPRPGKWGGGRVGVGRSSALWGRASNRWHREDQEWGRLLRNFLCLTCSSPISSPEFRAILNVRRCPFPRLRWHFGAMVVGCAAGGPTRRHPCIVIYSPRSR